MPKRKREKAAYGDGSIYPNPDGSFTVAVRLQRRAKPLRRRAPDRQAAEALKAELLRLRDAKVDITAGSQSVEAFTAYWYNEVFLQRGRAERTNKHTLDMLELHILPVIGRQPLLDIDHAALQQLLNDLRRRRAPKKPLSAQTVHHVYSVLKQVFGKALTMNLIERDPTVGLEMPEITRPVKMALTTTQIRGLLATVEGHPYALAYHLMCFLGLRLGEALALRRTDFNQDFSEVHVQQAIDYHELTMGTPKRESKRRLPVPPILAARCRAQWEALKTQQADPTPGFTHGGLLLPSEVGTPIQPSNFEKVWNGYAARGRRYTGFKQKAHLPTDTTLHSLRGFLATELEGLDVGQRTIGHILGHGAKNVTEVYIRRALPTMRRALERLEAAVWSEAGEQSAAM